MDDSRIRAIIIDNDKSSIYTLEGLLQQHCPSVEVVSTPQTMAQGVESVNRYKPDIVFLDIVLSDGMGFDLLDRVAYKAFQTVFITGHDRYAIKAFKFAALHYLLKPIKPMELKQAVSRFEKSQKKAVQPEKISFLRKRIPINHSNIQLPSNDGLKEIEIEDITLCEIQDDLTVFHLKSGGTLSVPQPIDKFAHTLTNFDFAQINPRSIINLKFVKRYISGTEGHLIMNNDQKVDVAELNKDHFINKMYDFMNR